jgi:hypothetical protein
MSYLSFSGVASPFFSPAGAAKIRSQVTFSGKQPDFTQGIAGVSCLGLLPKTQLSWADEGELHREMLKDNSINNPGKCYFWAHTFSGPECKQYYMMEAASKEVMQAWFKMADAEMDKEKRIGYPHFAYLDGEHMSKHWFLRTV